MSTEKKEAGYLFTKNAKMEEVRDFQYCESMMYYNEPKKRPDVYSEFDGVFKSISYNEKQGCYEVTNPLNNNVSKYFYSEGILEKAIVKHALMTLYLYRKSDE